MESEKRMDKDGNMIGWLKDNLERDKWNSNWDKHRKTKERNWRRKKQKQTKKSRHKQKDKTYIKIYNTLDNRVGQEIQKGMNRKTDRER